MPASACWLKHQSQMPLMPALCSQQNCEGQQRIVPAIWAPCFVPYRLTLRYTHTKLQGHMNVSHYHFQWCLLEHSHIYSYFNVQPWITLPAASNVADLKKLSLSFSPSTPALLRIKSFPFQPHFIRLHLCSACNATAFLVLLHPFFHLQS